MVTGTVPRLFLIRVEMVGSRVHEDVESTSAARTKHSFLGRMICASCHSSTSTALAPIREYGIRGSILLRRSSMTEWDSHTTKANTITFYLFTFGTSHRERVDQLSKENTESRLLFNSTLHQMASAETVMKIMYIVHT